MAEDPKAPVVTVLMPVFNSARFLREAVDSVLAQSFHAFELLIVNDGSTDDSAGILASCRDPRIRIITNERNLGLVASLNKGIAAARSEYIARMDADDRMHPERLAEQLKAMRADGGIAVLASVVELINTDGEVYGTWDTDRSTLTEVEISGMLPRTNCIAHPSVMIRRSALGELRYDPRQHGAEDWDLWLRMRSRGHRIAKLNAPLLQYRVHAGSIMAGTKQEASLERRLLRTRWRYLAGELLRGRINGFNARVLWAQCRTLARVMRGWCIAVARDTKRSLSYPPFAVMRQERLLKRTLSTWTGEHLFLFPYLNIGGAEKVHTAILAAVQDSRPLVLITGFSTDHGYEHRFREHAEVLVLPHVLNHPRTRRRAERLIAEWLNSRRSPVLFSSLTTTFFELLPLLRPQVRAYWLQHAFLHQPTGNVQHKGWLRHFGRINGFGFVSRQAMEEYKAFLFTNGVPRSEMGSLIYLPNCVQHPVAPLPLRERVGVLFVGRDSPEKRVDLFVQICEKLHRSLPEAFHFTVVGIDQRRNSAGIRFTGNITDEGALSALYAEHDLLVLTSEREGFPMVIMEAMAYGLAVVSTPVGDVPNRLSSAVARISSSVEGNVVVAEMTAVILELARDREQLWHMRQAAFAQASVEFGPEPFRARYRSLLMSPPSAT